MARHVSVCLEPAKRQVIPGRSGGGGGTAWDTALKKVQYDPETARRRSIHRLAGHLARDTGLC
eukprot:41824-Prorocentrum_lima.AAC.1